MSKYRAQPTVVDGIRFASRGEARRYQELRLLALADEIDGLELQVKYPLVVNGVKVGDYIADFCYVEKGVVGGKVVEDFKGVRTPVYRLKKKLMKALHGIDIRESGA